MRRFGGLRKLIQQVVHDPEQYGIRNVHSAFDEAHKKAWADLQPRRGHVDAAQLVHYLDYEPLSEGHGIAIVRCRTERTIRVNPNIARGDTAEGASSVNFRRPRRAASRTAQFRVGGESVAEISGFDHVLMKPIDPATLGLISRYT